MKLKLLTSLSGPAGSWNCGDEYSCDASEAESLIAAGFAEPMKEKDKIDPEAEAKKAAAAAAKVEAAAKKAEAAAAKKAAAEAEKAEAEANQSADAQ